MKIIWRSDKQMFDFPGWIWSLFRNIHWYALSRSMFYLIVKKDKAVISVSSAYNHLYKITTAKAPGSTPCGLHTVSFLGSTIVHLPDIVALYYSGKNKTILIDFQLSRKKCAFCLSMFHGWWNQRLFLHRERLHNSTFHHPGF